MVAEGWADLTDGSLLHAIDTDELGDAVLNPKNVWTNTAVNGMAESMEDCAGFTTKAFTTTIGRSSATDATWTVLLAMQVCSGENRLYCFEDGGG